MYTYFHPIISIIRPIQKQHNQTGIATVSVSPNKLTPTELKDLNFKSQNKLKHCNKTSKKRKTPISSSLSISHPNINRIKLTQDYFKFINWKENSCIFDSILALIYFLHQDDPNIFKSQNKENCFKLEKYLLNSLLKIILKNMKK